MTKQPEARKPDQPLGLASTEQVGPLPPYVYGRECAPNERVLTERDVRAYASQERAAERERILAALPGGHSVDPQWVADLVRGWPNVADKRHGTVLRDGSA